MSFTLAREAHAFNFSIEPARLELSVPAGKRRGKTVTVDNSKSDQPTHLTVYVQDVLYLPDGTHDFPPPGSTDWSCAKWLQVTPAELDIPAGKTADVRVSVLAPEGGKGGHYAILFFETEPSYTGEKGIGINFRIGALVEVVVPKTEVYHAKLANLAFNSQAGEIVVDIFNEGNLLIRPMGKLKVFDRTGARTAQLDLNPNRLGVLPKTLRKYSVKLDNPLAQGDYKLKTEIDYGSKYLLVGELPLTIK